MTKKRKICLFSGNRTDYGLQVPLLKAMAKDPRLEVSLLAGGAHLNEDFGKTVEAIRRDGFEVAHEVEIDLPEDTLFGTAVAIGSGVISIARILKELRPDWMVAPVDRFESFAAVIAATQMGIPTAHLEGGDYTEGGALDDSVRHAMTKLSHIHFTTNEQSADWVRQMGEEPWRVHNVGLPTLDLAAAGDFTGPEELRRDLKLDPDRPLILFCQHSVTTEYDRAAEQINPSLAALKRLALEGCQIILTYPNNDAGGRVIISEIQKSFPEPGPNVQIHKNLGRSRFLGMLHLIGRVGRGGFLGNSSGLIKETSFFGCPSIHIGTRQRGRLRGNNVFDVGYREDEIYHWARRAIDDPAIRTQCASCDNPYGAGNAGPRIADVLATTPIDARLIQKKMTYLRAP